MLSNGLDLKVDSEKCDIVKLTFPMSCPHVLIFQTCDTEKWKELFNKCFVSMSNINTSVYQEVFGRMKHSCMFFLHDKDLIQWEDNSSCFIAYTQFRTKKLLTIGDMYQSESLIGLDPLLINFYLTFQYDLFCPIPLVATKIESASAMKLWYP